MLNKQLKRGSNRNIIKTLSLNLSVQMWCLQQLPSENAAFDGPRPQGRKWMEPEEEEEEDDETFSARNFFCPFWIRSQKEERGEVAVFKMVF